MAGRPEHLPDYLQPPIDEVAIAVQFPEIEGCTATRLREFWIDVRGEYPFVEAQPPLIVPLESEGRPKPLQIQFMPASANVRLWMISASDDFLIQVQNTRFIQNWRRRSADYPHFEEVRELFWSNLAKFRTFLRRSGLPVPEFHQVEVTYINWISDRTVSEFLRPASEAELVVDGSPMQADAQNWSARYNVSNDLGAVARLYIESAEAVRARDIAVSGTQLSLVFRAAKATGIADNEVTTLIDDARTIIVEAFDSITTPTAQEAWGRLP